MDEEYVEIKGYEGLYWINKKGEVKSRYRVKKLSINKDGYYIVNLSKNGKGKSFYIHRLLALHFIPNPDNLPQVNHKDENKLNNDLNNLEWCTQDYNFHYGTRGIRSGQTQRKTSPKRKPVIQYSLDMEFIAEFSSVAEAARQLNFCHSTISQCCKGNYKQAYGYIWKYKNI